MLARAVTDYIHVKDWNRPFLLRRVFAQDAVLEISVESGGMSFPPRTTGVDAIADVLV